MILCADLSAGEAAHRDNHDEEEDRIVVARPTACEGPVGRLAVRSEFSISVVKMESGILEKSALLQPCARKQPRYIKYSRQ